MKSVREGKEMMVTVSKASVYSSLCEYVRESDRASEKEGEERELAEDWLLTT